MREALETIFYHQQLNHIVIIDQTQLPNRLEYKTLTTAEEVWTAINRLEVRGAPLIGITAAYGLAMCARRVSEQGGEDIFLQVARLRKYLESARPTAVNLKNALDEMEGSIRTGTAPED